MPVADQAAGPGIAEVVVEGQSIRLREPAA